MAQPSDVHEIADPLAEAYKRSAQRITAELEGLANDPKQAAKRRRLREIQRGIFQQMTELDGEAAEWVATQLPKVYAAGGAIGATGATQGAGDFVWSQVHQEAAQRLANRLYKDLLTATKHVRQDTKELIRAVGADKALAKAIEGKTAQQAGREMARVLKSKGISAITYANGAKHGLAEYSEMAIRTVTATTYNEGILHGAAEHGTEFWEVFDGPFCGWTSHDDSPAAGRIVSKDEALAWPVSHPNCRRAFGPRPDVRTPADAKDASPFTTAEQRQAQIAADAAKHAKPAAGPPAKAPKIEKPLPPMEDAAHLPLIDAVSKVPTVEKLIDEGWHPAKAIEEHKRLLKNARNVERRARNKAKVAGAPGEPTAPKATASSVHPKILEDIANASKPGSLPAALYDHLETPVNGTRFGPGGVKGRLWFDRMADTPDYVPVIDLTVQGRLVRNGIATRRNGVSYMLEIPAGELATDAVKAELEANIKMAETVLQSVPGGMRVHQRGFAFLKGHNPMDTYWAEKYSKPDFKSAATGGDGSTTFWNSPTNPSVIAHELGHNIDAGWAKAVDPDNWVTALTSDTLGGGKTWTQAKDLDGESSKLFGKLGFTETRPGKPITPGQVGVTEYGGADIKEDFAESVRLYLKDRREGKIGYLAPKPGQALGTNVRFADMFPERATFLDKIFGQKSDFNTPWRTEQIAMFKKDIKDLVHSPDDPAIAFGSGFQKTGAKHYGLRQVDVDKALAEIKLELAAEAAAEKAAQEALKAAEEAAAAAQTPLTPKDLSFGDKTGIGVKAGNAKKAALAAGKTPAEAQQVFNETKAALIQAKLDELNAARGIKTGSISAQVNSREMRPGFVNGEKGRLATRRYIHPATVDAHPLAQTRSSVPAIQSKSNIAAELGSRMNNEKDWQLYRDYRKATNRDDPGEFSKVSSARRQQLLDGEASERVQTWASTSGDTNKAAVSMQQAVKDEFGVTGDAMVRVGSQGYGDTRADIQAYYNKVAPFYRRFARHMYEHTQEHLKAAGITEVHVYRGMNFSPTPAWALKGEHRPLLQPANSWAPDLATARKFGRTIFSATIPADRVLGSTRTGFGCFNEFEYVIFDTEGLAKVGANNEP